LNYTILLSKLMNDAIDSNLTCRMMKLKKKLKKIY